MLLRHGLTRLLDSTMRPPPTWRFDPWGAGMPGIQNSGMSGYLVIASSHPEPGLDQSVLVADRAVVAKFALPAALVKFVRVGFLCGFLVPFADSLAAVAAFTGWVSLWMLGAGWAVLPS